MSELNITGDLYNLWMWHGRFNTPLIGVTKIILFTLTWLCSSSSFVGLPVANAPDVLQPCDLLYYPWCSNSHPKRSWQSEVELTLFYLDVPTLTTSRLPRDPSSQRWNYVGEKWPMNFAWNARLPCSNQESFTCRKSTTWDRRLYFPSEGRRAEDFFALKNSTASTGFEPANLGTKGQHATSRSPKPLGYTVTALMRRYAVTDARSHFFSTIWIFFSLHWFPIGCL